MRIRTAANATLGLLSSLGSTQNYLGNPGFESWYTNQNGGYNASYVGGLAGGSGVDGTCATDWTFFNFVDGTTTTQRATPPPGLTGAGSYSMYVTASNAGDGIGQITEQTIGGQGAQPVPYSFVGGWVYVTQGSAGIGWFDQATQQDNVVASTSVLNQWVYLSDYLPAVQSPAFLILGLSTNSQYYADNMDAEPTPEPAPFVALGLGALGLLRRRRPRVAA